MYMIDGILLIDKEENITSYTAIRMLKRILPKGQKIGHAGTLDPFATGLLIVLLGKVTKLMDTIHSLDKEYEVKAEFGYATDTQDCTGEKIKTSPTLQQVSKEELEENIKTYLIGNISQLPPQYSAKKINGQKAYDLAREGNEVVLKPKDISVYSFDIVEYNWPFVTFRIRCSTGTYIRTLVNDLGEKVGTYATAVGLRRTNIGEFDVESAISTKDINEQVVESIMGIDKVKEVLKI
jgi:tRNA pseudouridine55 synthase